MAAMPPPPPPEIFDTDGRLVAWIEVGYAGGKMQEVIYFVRQSWAEQFLADPRSKNYPYPVAVASEAAVLTG